MAIIKTFKATNTKLLRQHSIKILLIKTIWSGSLSSI
nr:MAG TPA: hypothetical protein [Caudoviricetes sp.]